MGRDIFRSRNRTVFETFVHKVFRVSRLDCMWRPIDVQGVQATRNQAQRDGGRLGPLITNVNPQVFQRPTFSLFLSLLDNYERFV